MNRAGQYEYKVPSALRHTAVVATLRVCTAPYSLQALSVPLQTLPVAMEAKQAASAPFYRCSVKS